MVTGVGFEPTPPERLVPKTSALDHSATQPLLDERLALLNGSGIGTNRSQLPSQRIF